MTRSGKEARFQDRNEQPSYQDEIRRSYPMHASQNQTQKNRITQDAMFVEVRINMKSYYDFMFFSTVCSSCKGFKCVTQKLEDPKQ